MRRFRLLLGLALLVTAPALLLLACDTVEAPPSTVTPETPTPHATPAEAAIVIESPAEGETVTSPVEVSGTASVFEATLFVAVKDSQGRTLCEVVTMASEGAPGRGDFAVSLGLVPPDEETDAEIVAYTRSPKDGSIRDEVIVPVTLSAEAPPVVVTSPRCGQEVTSPILVEGSADPGTDVEIVVGGLFGGELGRATLQTDAQGNFSGEVELQIDQAQTGVVEASLAGAATTLFPVPVVLTP